MNIRPQRRVRPDMMIALAVLVGLGVLVTTSVQAQDRQMPGTGPAVSTGALCDNHGAGIYGSSGQGVEVRSTWTGIKRVLFPHTAESAAQPQETAPQHTAREAQWGMIVGHQSVVLSIGKKW